MLYSRFARLRVWPAHGYLQGQPPEGEQWLLIEWPQGEAKPTKYWLSTLPRRISLVHLVRQAKARWRVEQDYKQVKEELGLDHYEGRCWRGWHHHVTLVTVAYGFLVRERLGRRGGNPTVSIPQVRQEIQYMLYTWTGQCAVCGQPVPTVIWLDSS